MAVQNRSILFSVKSESLFIIISAASHSRSSCCTKENRTKHRLIGTFVVHRKRQTTNSLIAMAMKYALAEGGYSKVRNSAVLSRVRGRTHHDYYRIAILCLLFYVDVFPDRNCIMPSSDVLLSICDAHMEAR